MFLKQVLPKKAADSRPQLRTIRQLSHMSGKKKSKRWTTAHIFYLYSLTHLLVAIKSGKLLNMLADISTKLGISEHHLNITTRANKMGLSGDHL